MAIDKAIDSAKEAACRTAEANAIRAKTGNTAQLTYDFDNGKGFADAIESIETGITPTGNVELSKQSGNDVTQYASASVRSASISLNTPTVDANGLITASATVDTSGWIGSAPSSATKQLSTQAATTITPTESSQTAVESGKYTTGAVTVAAVPSETKTVDLNMASGNQVVSASSGKWMTSVTVNKPATLLPENIKKDVNISGVVGTMESGGGKGGDYNIVQTNDGDNCSLAITDANTFVLTTKTITENGTYNASADNADGYSQVTVNVASGGGGGAGFSVTFPATAKNWNKITSGGIVQVDGTVVSIADYSTLAGQTIPNVLEICILSSSLYFPRMTVQTGKIMITHINSFGVFPDIIVDGESSRTYMVSSSSSRWIPLADTVISAIEMYNTD